MSVLVGLGIAAFVIGLVVDAFTGGGETSPSEWPPDIEHKGNSDTLRVQQIDLEEHWRRKDK